MYLLSLVGLKTVIVTKEYVADYKCIYLQWGRCAVGDDCLAGIGKEVVKTTATLSYSVLRLQYELQA